MILYNHLIQIIEAHHHNPFEVLGLHRDNEQTVIRVFLPLAEQVQLHELNLNLDRIPNTDLFTISLESTTVLPLHYRLRWIDKHGQEHINYDPYTFLPYIGDLDLHLHGEGTHWYAYQMLGAHPMEIDGIYGVRFAVWSPSAVRVSVVGDFNAWDGRTHPMQARGNSGVWELFIPELTIGSLYKYELRTANGTIVTKTDPYAASFQLRPDTACIITDQANYMWQDAKWLQQRAANQWQHQPISIYEVHLGSWRRSAEGQFLNYRELAQLLAVYVSNMGFTHIELMPITEHPLDASWGYQTTGYFAPTSRFGSPQEFRYFVDTLHQAGIGVILDWVPAHFPRDTFALAQFDGSSLYEHADPRQGEHRDWGTLIFNYGRNEVKNFLLASALFWLEEYHIDGLRVDAVASMLYLDYSKAPGDWIPNKYGGRENLEAVEFLRQLNIITHERFPGSLIIAEESTSWPGVSRPTYVGGLGFSMKWNMGWMHDVLNYMAQDPIYRNYHHHLLTFGMLYAFNENFILPFSHDEVVHGKRSMLDKMPGDIWQKFASLRLLYTFLFSIPGKKLLFMGSEFAQGREWNHAEELEWYLLERLPHQGIHQLICDLNAAYKNYSSLHAIDFEPSGFAWIDCNDNSQSVLSFLRTDSVEKIAIIILNFTPILRKNYRIGVPKAGFYRELINSDAALYWGSNQGNNGGVHSEPIAWMGRDHSLMITLPPLAGLILIPEL